MVYMWKCSQCQHITDVNRKVADIDVPPDDGCENCQSKEVVRGIYEWSKTQISLVHGGRAPWFSESYLGPKGIPTGK